ncbi:NAD-dependent epimerase/dehydratase family protein [Sinorhizobium sp. BG8]|uniref:NAD-dependent epimerase/dehydratase family protein n=1 Tax=Sinorhizobium sp. BG8 TaxID=2613773 RepID=UPI00193CF0C6|nr:NAD-dependent epimerase/dehydratase family protein [Sinorhizobium sp. BG8]QRM56084.1 NAD-dependent epimerase/dehydratase family protein [Sinorhizobium sp. BG8]
MRHLITGGSGFIGNLIARRLRERGEEVRLLDVWSDPSRPPDIEFVESSVLDREGVARAMREVDVVHHNAALVAQTGAGRRYWEVNVEGTRIVAEEAARARVGAVVHLSTTAVYGIPPRGAITASTPLRPVEPYGRSKLAGEELMKRVCDDAGLPLTTIRPRATLGAGRLGIFQVLFEWIRENRNVYVIGDGHHRMQFVHAYDLMDFYMLALDAKRPGTYNVGTDRFGTLAGDLEELIVHAGSTSRVVGLPPILAVNALRLLYHMRLSPLVPWHYLTYHRECHFDVAPLLEMGWKPRWSNADMLSESYDWYCVHAAGGQSPEGSPHRSPLKQRVLKVVKRLS